MKLFAAIDIGTTHCKAVIIDTDGRVVYSNKQNITSVQDDHGKHEQDAEEIFSKVLTLLTACFEEKNAADICSVSFSAAMHSMLAVDTHGKPLMHAMTWADTRSGPYARQLRNTNTGKEIYARTGTPVYAMSPLCKLLWLKQEQPDIFNAAGKFISIKEYIFYRLFEKYIVDEGIASATGLYNSYTYNWDETALKLTGIDASKLSTVVPATHIETGLTAAIQQTLKINRPLPFIPGGNDGCLANLGCGALTNDIAVLTIGTSGAVRLTMPPEKNSNTLSSTGNGLFRYLLTRETIVIGGPINNGGIALEWFADNILQLPLLKENNFEKVMQLAAGAKPGPDGPLFLPYLLGERAPVWDEAATGLFYGLRISHNSADLARAVIEGICFSLLQILKETAQKNAPVQGIYVSGIITRSDFWMQLLADIFGKKVILNDVADASAMGAAFMGMYATGFITSLQAVDKFIKPDKLFEADMAMNKLYENKYRRFIRLYPATQSVTGGE